MTPANLDFETVEGFGREWRRFPQTELDLSERSELFRKYFSLVDWNRKPSRALDMGCGSGRWAVLAAPLVDELVAVDASQEALEVAKKNVTAPNVSFIHSTPEELPFPEGYFDLIFSLGVLHHVPDTKASIACLVKKLRPGGSLLLYLYYAFDGRPAWFRALWRMTDVARHIISKLPFAFRHVISDAIAVCVYWPLARTAKYVKVPHSWPLKFYADRSFYVMRTDSLDRFGTKLEQRFTRVEIAEMLEAAGLHDVRFSDSEPFWVCRATKPQ